MPISPDDVSARPALSRLTTGDHQLDQILGGGFPSGSINIIMGEPGSGKTILVERLMFANAANDGRPILFLTTLSEPLDKVVRYLQQFEFYDQTLLGDAIRYESIGDELAREGISALATRLKEAILTDGPSIIVIDSFKAIHELAGTGPQMRLMLYEVAGLLTAFDTTTFLIGEYQSDQMAHFPEFAVADGVVQLTRNMLTHQDERFIRVLKLRGSCYEEGQHALYIGNGGIEVSPRLVSPRQSPDYQEQLDRRVCSGVRGLDALLAGGITVGRSTFLVGPTGSGKSTIGLQFVVEGVRNNEQALHLSFEENPTRLISNLKALDFDPVGESKASLHSLYVSPVEMRLDRVIREVFDVIQRENVSRVVIDAVGDLLAAAGSEERLHAYLYALAQHFTVRGVTSLFLYEAIEMRATSRLSALADNIVSLGVSLEGGRATRWLRVVKARGTHHDMHEHPLTIGGRGASVG